MKSLLKLHGFGVAYGDKVVLRGIDFEVPARGCTALLGPAGTGKSTLLRTLAGYNNSHPALRTWGRARYHGRDLAEDNRPAMVMQKSQFLISTVWDNLVFDIKDRGRLTRAQQREKIEALLHRTGQEHLLDKLNEKVVSYSIAQQRGIAILRQALSEPDLLMIDEPTTNLPEAEVPPLHRLLHELSQDRALLVVSHNQAYAREMADRVVLIANGVTQEVGDAKTFFQSPTSEIARHFIRTGSCPEDSRVSDEVEVDADDENETDAASDGSASSPAAWSPGRGLGVGTTRLRLADQGPSRRHPAAGHRPRHRLRPCRAA